MQFDYRKFFEQYKYFELFKEVTFYYQAYGSTKNFSSKMIRKKLKFGEDYHVTFVRVFSEAGLSMLCKASGVEVNPKQFSDYNIGGDFTADPLYHGGISKVNKAMPRKHNRMYLYEGMPIYTRLYRATLVRLTTAEPE